MRVTHALLVSAVVSAGLLAQSAPCFETSLGTNIGALDDSVTLGLSLGFTFPGPGGNYTDIDISSNGFIWLGTSINHQYNNGCCSGDATGFVTDDPRIAGMWMDLYPPGAPAGGGVFFNTFPAGGGYPARAVVTWSNCPEYYGLPTITAQVQLMDTGEILISNAASNVLSSQYHSPLVGVTQGLGATPNAVPFASMGAGGVNTGTNPTVYQHYSIPPNYTYPLYDLNGYTLWFIPNGQGGYLVTTVCNSPPPRANYMTFGVGCLNSPQSYTEAFTGVSPTFDLSNSTISMLNIGTSYLVQTIPGSPAWFTPTSTSLAAGPYGMSVNTWDDAISNTINLPWTITYPTGSTSAIQVGSNGILYLQPTANTYDPWGYYNDDYTYLNKPATLAVCYGDQDVTASPSYGIYYDVDPSGNAVYITWITAEWLGPTQDFQIMIDSGGNIEYRYQSIGMATAPILVGWSPGNGLTDRGQRDISTSPPFFTGDGSLATTLTNTGGALPTLGSTFSQDVGNIRPGSPAGLMFYGFGNLLPTGFSLAPFGAPDCTQWINLLVNQLFFVTGSTTAVTLPIPNTPSLAGVVLQSQAAVLSPGVNALGAVVSNGAALTLGF